MDSKPVLSSPLLLTSGASTRVSALISLRALRSLALLLNGLLLLLLLPFRRRPEARCFSGKGSPEKSKEEKIPATNLPEKVKEAGIRRSMAIRQFAESCDGETERGFSIFDTMRGDTLFTRWWMPIGLEIKGLVLLLHGLNEHSGRYDRFAKELNANGYKVYGMDWIGHGGSDGLHGYVPSLDYAVTDMKGYLLSILAENPGLPCFCFGHSTGAAIVLKAVLDPNIEGLVEAVILTSPAIRVQPSHPIFGIIAPIFSFLVPKYQFSAANKQGLPVSRDPEALVAKYSDPLVYTGSIRVRTGTEILRISSYLQQNLRKIRVPFFVLHGTADTVTDPEASRELYEEASSTVKSIKLYEGFLHDLLFEPERDEITKDIIDWMNSRLKP
ncbi:hypothetical protein AMTR_s00024p00066670 [Amborella trichopoda]|uniref:Serine aminopeptidase S33 domain-containing protein n=2 Tax=Amborella trichopoda TaxID=13333 RepID=W1PLW9_AMBTC|nr:hypothetical protein AMTR_s00024p00066670 [Amborella trichopoda]